MDIPLLATTLPIVTLFQQDQISLFPKWLFLKSDTNINLVLGVWDPVSCHILYLQCYQLASQRLTKFITICLFTKENISVVIIRGLMTIIHVNRFRILNLRIESKLTCRAHFRNLLE